MKIDKTMTWEQSVQWLHSQPEYAELVEQCYFDLPVSNAVQRYEQSEEWKELLSWLPVTPGRAFDLGAGNGIVSFALARAGWKVTALEPDPSRLVGANAIRGLADEFALPIEVLEEFGESIPCADNSFDLVVARQVIHHANDLGKMYKEMARITKPGGKIIAFRDHVIDSPASLEVFLNNHPLHNLYGGENAFRLTEYQEAIQNAGLQIDSEFHQFDTVVNYAPKSKLELCETFSKVGIISPLRFLLKAAFNNQFVFSATTRIASALYRKPGRLVTFICSKPVA